MLSPAATTWTNTPADEVLPPVKPAPKRDRSSDRDKHLAAMCEAGRHALTVEQVRAGGKCPLCVAQAKP